MLHICPYIHIYCTYIFYINTLKLVVDLLKLFYCLLYIHVGAFVRLEDTMLMSMSLPQPHYLITHY